MVIGGPAVRISGRAEVGGGGLPRAQGEVAAVAEVPHRGHAALCGGAGEAGHGGERGGVVPAGERDLRAGSGDRRRGGPRPP
jgi:hypothetical protein